MGDIKTTINDAESIKEGFKQALIEKEHDEIAEEKERVRRENELRILEQKERYEEEQRMKLVKRNFKQEVIIRNQKPREFEIKKYEANLYNKRASRRFWFYMSFLVLVILAIIITFSTPNLITLIIFLLSMYCLFRWLNLFEEINKIEDGLFLLNSEKFIFDSHNKRIGTSDIFYQVTNMNEGDLVGVWPNIPKNSNTLPDSIENIFFGRMDRFSRISKKIYVWKKRPFGGSEYLQKYDLDTIFTEKSIKDLLERERLRS